MTSPRTVLNDRIKDVLAGHGVGPFNLDEMRQSCECGWMCEPGVGFHAHRAHLASVLTDTVAAELAEAWRQGCLAVCNGGIDECGHSEPHMHPEANPYVRQAGDEG